MKTLVKALLGTLSIGCMFLSLALTFNAGLGYLIINIPVFSICIYLLNYSLKEKCPTCKKLNRSIFAGTEYITFFCNRCEKRYETKRKFI